MILWGLSPGIVVMGSYLCPEGRRFESLYRTLDGHFSHIFVVKIVIFEKTKKRKRGRKWPNF